MFDKEQFGNFLEEKLDVAVELDEVGQETVLLYHEEIDENLILEDELKLLPNPVLFQLYSYQAEHEWIVGVAMEEATYNPLFLVCLKDGERVYNQSYKK
ncbi:hypothetical protein M3568_18375 [Priestia flexa]|uniref:hypothetical protein n=1 Tax=Priestia flexa TaxID=86664 RepID=UPI00203BAD6F|nr:hypothetical protein [Priestia flexa]MCM3068290.1 hypothetical protein [Priestia flexa]